MSSQFDKYWLVFIIILLACLVSGGIILATKLNVKHPIDISLTTTKPPDYQLEVFIDGAVANPGIYPAKEADTIANLIEAAGLTADANPAKLKLYISKTNEPNLQTKGQKINLNQADAWLLEALPGIGQSKAQAIIDYRNNFGTFRRIEDLLKVNGISKSTLENIRNFITVEN